ncbi:trypsin-like peptidase domain-containing protein [Thalassoglobus sp. JC818]|uniref:trypsin-like peptidase domain-containing protein n=1 Tax=Thalassoglobus sp. JC818 TaxID=3232136 RepID=UPI00345B10AE
MTNHFRQLHTWLALLTVTIATSAYAEEEFVSVRNTHRTRIVQRALQSSVNIHTEKRQKSLDVVFSAGKASKINGMGSGIIIDERGYIVTNYHVVQDVERLRVTTFDGAEYEGRVLAYDAQKDLAVIKIEPRTSLIVGQMGSSSDLMLGEDVIAIGNAYGYESTVTLGIVSHKSRDVEVNEEQAYENLIQIDAAINPGNSGGPLLNVDGDVIGINVAIRAGAQRIGFAIPIDDARRTVARLINIERHHQTYHGVRAIDYKNGRDRKFVVQSTMPGSPASAAGLENGDVIIRSGSVDVVDATDFERSLFGKRAGEAVDLVVLRDGKEESLQLSVGSLTGQRSTMQNQIANRAQSPDRPMVSSTVNQEDESVWQTLGLKLSKVASSTPLPRPYNGGFEVVDLRPQGPASTRGIQRGDILVGLDKWETVKRDDIDYVLNQHQSRLMGPLKFYIVRNGETLYGEIPFAVSQR